MTVRFRSRHLHATLFDYVRAQLITLGWGNAALPGSDPANTNVNFDGVPVSYLDFQPDDAGHTIKPNTIAVTLGDEPAAEDQELGSELRSIGYPVFIDVYGANQAVAQSITSDIRDLFDGDLYLVLKDYTQAPPVETTEQIELLHDDVQVVRPPASIGVADIRRFWRVVNALATVYTSPAELLVVDGGGVVGSFSGVVDGGTP